MRKIFFIVLLLTLNGCLGMPQTIKPVNNFELKKYLGQWYEIARLDHSFERGLSNVTAKYDLRDDGGVTVTNRGFSAKNQKWKEAKGKAYFVKSESEGYLKVSFFGPFYGSYVIFELDRENYSYAFVSGPNNDYLWLLSRTPHVDSSLVEKFETMANELGFNTKQLIYVAHN